MQEDKDEDFCNITLSQLYEDAYDCEIKVVGAVKEIFKHRKYIVELFVKNNVVIRCLKRYNQFQALYQVMQMNFKNIDLGIKQFPSKYQVFDKQQTRRKYFEQLLNRIVQTYLEKITNQTNRRLLSTLYVFLSNGVHRKDKLRISKEKGRKKSDSIGSKSADSNEQYESVYSNGTFKEENIQHKNQQRSLQSQDTAKIQEQMKKKAFEDIDVSTEEGKMRAFMNIQFMIKFEGQNQWKQRYFKLQGSNLLIYRHKNDNNFKTKMEIFQAQIGYFCRQKNFVDHFCQKMQIDNLALFPADKSVLTIMHNYDYKRFLVMMKPNQKLDLNDVRKILINASHIKPSNEIQGVFDPVAKIFIILHKIHFTNACPKTAPIVYLRIKMAGYVYETKRMTYSSDSPLSIRQSFMIPISNTFVNIFIEVIAIQNDGFLRKQTQEKVVGFYRLCFADFISYPSGKGLQKLQVKIEQNNPNPFYQGFMQISAINYSHLSSIYGDSFANVNDGIIMNGIKNSLDTEDLILTVDRVLRVVGNLALFITAFWRNVYLFKYPRMSYVFFSWLIILFNFGNSFLYIRLFVCNLLIAMIYQYPRAKQIIDNVLEIYFFKYIHPSFIAPRSISSGELKFRKWASNMQNIIRDYRLTDKGRLEKKPEAKDRKYQEWTFTVHGKTFTVREENPSLLEKVFQAKKIIELISRMVSAVINSVEKLLNILCWADPMRSIWMFVILLFLVTVAEAYIFQIIGTVFCIHRFVKGHLFYERKHYSSNRKLAVYCLRYIINTHFSYLIPYVDKRITTINQDDIEIIFHEICFPLRDEQKLKKFKEDIEHILGVYIDNEELEKNARKNSVVALIHFVSIIESCEARLKLEWISGEEGISEDFQDLKRLTNEEVVIDLWVQSLIINFVLNIPSQLYTAFRPIRSEESLKYEKIDNKPAEFKKIPI